MDFAPYQASPPETGRSSTSTPRTSLDVRRTSFSPPLGNTWAPSPSPPLLHPQPQRRWLPSLSSLISVSSYTSLPIHSAPAPHLPGAFPADRLSISEFETTLGLRLDHEAALAYVVFPPIGSLLLLICERKSDYVRFHAAQAALLFVILGVIHWVLSWSGLLGWAVMMAEMAAGLYLAWRAWRDADSLERYEVPFVGPIASKFLGDE